jgi:hypothetical protein
MKRATFLTEMGSYIDIPIDHFFLLENGAEQIWLCSCHHQDLQYELDSAMYPTLETAQAVIIDALQEE